MLRVLGYEGCRGAPVHLQWEHQAGRAGSLGKGPPHAAAVLPSFPCVGSKQPRRQGCSGWGVVLSTARPGRGAAGADPLSGQRPALQHVLFPSRWVSLSPETVPSPPRGGRGCLSASTGLAYSPGASASLRPQSVLEALDLVQMRSELVGGRRASWRKGPCLQGQAAGVRSSLCVCLSLSLAHPFATPASGSQPPPCP